MRQALMYPGENGYRVVECPTLPGCISQGLTGEEAIKNTREAFQEYIASLEQDGMPVHEPIQEKGGPHHANACNHPRYGAREPAGSF